MIIIAAEACDQPQSFLPYFLGSIYEPIFCQRQYRLYESVNGWMDGCLRSGPKRRCLVVFVAVIVVYVLSISTH